MQGCDFICLDVETANSDQASICCVGLAQFVNGSYTASQKILIDPEDYYDSFHTSIHGISKEDTDGRPSMPQIYSELHEFLTGQTVVHHTHFDRVALTRSIARYELAPLPGRWLDSARVARRTWEACAYSGYGLPDLSAMLGFEFRHHSADEDARAAGLILIEAIKTSGLQLEQWYERVQQPLGWGPPADDRPRRKAASDAAYTGDTIVFTGKLERFARERGADLAAAAGFDVDDLVTKRTTILVVGEQHLRRLRGDGKSSKHLKAEKLSREGQAIRIIGEADFLALVGRD